MREPGAAAEAPRRKVQGGLCDSRVEGQSEWGEGGQHPKRRRCVGTRQQMWVSTREAVTTGLVSSKGGQSSHKSPSYCSVRGGGERRAMQKGRLAGH